MVKEGNHAGTENRIMVKLKQHTSELHQRIESLPYISALANHTLTPEHYLHQLRSLALIHAVFEHEIEDVEDAKVKMIWHDQLKKLHLLDDDIAFFKPRIDASSFAALNSAMEIAAKIRLRRAERPLTLLGYLYVLEGTTLGNDMHLPDITKTFMLEGIDGCSYYTSYGDRVHIHWQEFSQKMNSVLVDNNSHEAVIEAAEEAFLGLEKLYDNLYHLDDTRKTHATGINPEAGSHPMPDDEREIEAALLASNRAWDAFPYYQLRYGRRGKAFSDSDTCWLATLTQFPQERVQQQIDWLCRLLATRGMPSVMMEYTLKFLSEELTKIQSQEKERYMKLAVAADILEKRRLEHISIDDIKVICSGFDKRINYDKSAKYKNLCFMLISAVVDEKIVAEGTIDALLDWFTANEKFSKSEVETIYWLVEQARSCFADEDQKKS